MFAHLEALSWANSMMGFWSQNTKVCFVSIIACLEWWSTKVIHLHVNSFSIHLYLSIAWIYILINYVLSKYINQWFSLNQPMVNLLLIFYVWIAHSLPQWMHPRYGHNFVFIRIKGKFPHAISYWHNTVGKITSILVRVCKSSKLI